MTKTDKQGEELESIFRRWKTFDGMPNAKTAIRNLFNQALSQKEAEVLEGVEKIILEEDRKTKSFKEANTFAIRISKRLDQLKESK